ncbi:protein KRTCAP2 homolog [Sitophilus oryzae]|uniref:Protein KRTCAP2 homolog n=1 Tax=Sitophilus oryzae TaxID=7048 RepID=A0A6J2XCK7_SITOR|nr:protein KRTCAP2 homolog [Sitophilus oryzae]
MAVATKTSFILASISSLLLFSSMQIWKTWLASSSQNTLLGGVLGAFLFTLTLTAIGNLETLVLGKSYNLGLFPEVILAFFMALAAAATVHRVTGTSCFLLSLLALFYINKYSQKTYAQIVPQQVTVGKKKKN